MPQSFCDHFALLAPYYERLIPPGSRQKLLDILSLRPWHWVLDVGGGTGRIGKILRQYARQVTVADVSVDMLREACSKESLLPVNTPAERLPFADNTFDRVVMVDTLHHVANQATSVREMWRVCKPDGLVVIEEPDIRTMPVKFIALGEKILLMRSHFLSPHQIAALFNFTSRVIEIDADRCNTWIVVKR